MEGYNKGIVLPLGDTVDLTCRTCNGNPIPLVKWQETATGEELASSFVADASDCTNVSLSLGPVTEGHDGREYECSATNGIGGVRRGARTLTVQCKLMRLDCRDDEIRTDHCY